MTVKLLRKRSGRYPIDNIGILILAVLGLYSIIPSLSFLFLGDAFILFTTRIPYIPQIDDVVYLLAISNSFAFGLFLIYKTSKLQYKSILKHEVIFINDSILKSAIILFIIVSLSSIFLNIQYNLGDSSSYIDSYAEIASLPLIVKQFLAFQRGWVSILKIIVILGLFQRWPKSSYLLILIILFNILNFNVASSRTNLAISLFTFFILWHIVIRPFSKMKIFISGAVLMLGFSFSGLLRGGSGASSIVFTNLLNVSEFINVWLNSVHILHESKLGSFSIPWQVHLNDFLASIPSSILPWEKMDFSNWYANTYYPEHHEVGGGLAFGLNSQIVSGFGIPEAFIRGLIWGKISLTLINWVNTTKKWWVFPLYLSLFLFSYQVVRFSSFELITGSLLKYVFYFASLIFLKKLLISQKGRR